MDPSSSSKNENDDCMMPSFTGGEPFIVVDDDVLSLNLTMTRVLAILLLRSI